VVKTLIDKTSESKNIFIQKSHRIFHILNRNIEEKFSFEDIKSAFSNDDYTKSSLNDRFVYSRFFKECDYDDLEKLILVFGVSKKTIRKLYTSLPERKLVGVSEVWDKYFKLQPIQKEVLVHDDIQVFLKKFRNSSRVVFK